MRHDISFFALFVLYLYIKSGCCVSREKCEGLQNNQTEFAIIYWEFQPYIFNNTETHRLDGIFPELINVLNSTTPLQLTWRTQLDNYWLFYNHSACTTCSLPTSRGDVFVPVEVAEHENDPCMVRVLNSSGLAYVVRKNMNEPLKQLAGSFVSGGQVIGLTLILTGIAGICMWLLDRRSNPHDFPPSFVHGSWQGFWWAFVTMTTVGYGDLAPKSVFARLFSILWMLLGLVAFSVLTANFTSSLTHEIETDLNLFNKEVAVLRGSLGTVAAVQNGAKYKEYNHISEMLDALDKREVEGVLLDKHTAVTNKEISSQDSMDVGRMIPFAHTYGIRLRMKTPELCLAVKSCIEEIAETEVFHRTALKIFSDQTRVKTGSTATKSLFEDWEFFIILIGLFSAMTGTGVLWEYFYYRPREMRLNKIDSHDSIDLDGTDAEQRERNTPKYILTKNEVDSLCSGCCSTVEDIYKEEGRARFEAISSFNPLDGFAVIGAQLNSIPGVSSLKRFGHAVIPLAPIKGSQKKSKKATDCDVKKVKNSDV